MPTIIPQDDCPGHFVRYFIEEGGLPDLVQFASLSAGAVGIFQFLSEVKRTS
jgi:hypothetical protein